jgi:hypothetical protein
MTLYSCWFALAWVDWVCAAVGVLVLLLLPLCVFLPMELAEADGGPAWAFKGEWWPYVAFPLLALFCLWYTWYLLHHVRRVRVRAGAGMFYCFQGAVEPRSRSEVLNAVARLKRRNDDEFPEVVSGGWGYFLKRRGARRGHRLFLYRYRGRVNEDGALLRDDAAPLSGLAGASAARWAAGTPIAHVKEALRVTGYTLASHPTMDYIGVGTWVALGNHGTYDAHELQPPPGYQQLRQPSPFDLRRARFGMFCRLLRLLVSRQRRPQRRGHRRRVRRRDRAGHGHDGTKRDHVR